jgi:phenylalanyl-tRNA synthetase beta chain
VAEQWGEVARPLDFFDLKGDVESLLELTGAAGEFQFERGTAPWLHPGQSADIHRGDRLVGRLGALHPSLLGPLGLDEDVIVFELDLEPLAERSVPRAAGVSRYPSVRRDLSFELPEDVPYGRVEAAIRDAVGETLSDLIVFDRYAGANLGSGIKSLAIGLILQDRYRTLTDQDADRSVALAVAALESGCKAKLRG